jgi:hypothetical protein
LAITECHTRSTLNSQVVGHVTHKGGYVLYYRAEKSVIFV